MDNLKGQFLLDPEIIFLNHGSFGACPKPVFEVYQEWQRRLERQPVEFLGRKFSDLLAHAREELGRYLGVRAEEVVYFTNPTTAVNMVVRSLDIQSGDEILTSNHEYGAMNRTWRYVCRQTGARYVEQPIPLPVSEPQEVIEQFWMGVTSNTKVIFLSHITSATALIFPIEEIIRRARDRGILTIIDGAHAPGQIDLNLSQLGADLYTGACHKWLCAPKGAAFLYAHPDIQARLNPLVVSWGYESEFPSASQYVDHHEWQGTRDLSAFLSVPAAIQFQADHHWSRVRAACHQLALETRRRIDAHTGLEPISPESQHWIGQMVDVRLPQATDLVVLKNRLYKDYRIETPTILWNEDKFLRVSFQGYNSQQDADALVHAVQELLPSP